MWTLTKNDLDSIRKQISREFPTGKLNRIHYFLECLAYSPGSNYNGVQRGQQFLFPELPTKPVYAAEEFQWALALEEAFEVILGNYASCLARGATGELYLASDEPDYTPYLDNNQLFPPNKRWKAIFICRDGVYDKTNKKLCSDTLILARKARIGDGDIMFSILQKKTEIVPHYGLNNLHLTCHIGIAVNRLSFLKINDQKYRWKVGKCLIFDDTFYHSAANNSSKDRVIFLFDFWHPDLQLTEIKVLKHILPRINDLQKNSLLHIDFHKYNKRIK